MALTAFRKPSALEFIELAPCLAAVCDRLAGDTILDPRHVQRGGLRRRGEMRLLPVELDPSDIAAELAHLLAVGLPHRRRDNRVLRAPIDNDRCGRLHGHDASADECTR